MKHTAKANLGKAIRIPVSAARAADITPTMPYVLGGSLLLSASFMSLAWIIPALWL